MEVISITETELLIKRIDKIRTINKDQEEIDQADNLISSYQIAKKGNVHTSTLNKIFNGTAKDPRLSTVFKICKGLDISLKDFFDDDDLFN